MVEHTPGRNGDHMKMKTTEGCPMRMTLEKMMVEGSGQVLAKDDMTGREGK